MTNAEKFAYRGSLLAFFAVFAAVVAIGFIGEWISRSRSNFEKAEGFIADLQGIATGVPRSLDGTILRQGPLSTAWLDDAGALPSRLQAMAGTLRGGEDHRTLGLVRRGPWSFTFPFETRGSLVWTQLSGVPRTVCQQFAEAIVKHADQVAYISSSGNPAVIPAVQDLKSMCSQNFNNFAVITLDPATEVRRLSADVQNAIKAAPAKSTDKAPISGSSAPFQVSRGQDGGPGFIQTNQSRVRITINNVPFAVCRLALLMGPQVFGMDAFEGTDGKAAPTLTGTVPAKLCNAQKGRLIMTRS
jgi:hypothetical protein